MNNESSFWSIMGKISVILTIITAVYAIWVIFSQQAEDLELHIESVTYELNPRLKESVEKSFKVFSYFELRKAIKNELPQEIYKEFDFVEFIQKLHNNSWGDINEYNFDDYTEFTSVVVSNTGDRTATDIKIDIPTEGLALILTSDDSKKVVDFNKVISLDDIRAGNHTNITIWSRTRLYEYYYKNMNITHKNGVGDISWDIKVTGLGRYFFEYIYFLPMLIYLIFMLGVGSSMYFRKDSETK